MAGVYFIFSHFLSISRHFRPLFLFLSLSLSISFFFSLFFSAHSRHPFPLVRSVLLLSRFALSFSFFFSLSLPRVPLYCDDGRIIQSRLFTDFPSKEIHRLRAGRFLFLGASAVAPTFWIETSLISYSFPPIQFLSLRVLRASV